MVDCVYTADGRLLSTSRDERVIEGEGKKEGKRMSMKEGKNDGEKGG
jgi:hypothetical protein